jgi:two-component system, OmpR family, response regulator
VSALRLLFVDDDPDIRAIATLSLGLDPGFDVRSAGSGEEALAVLDKAGAWRPDGVLLDVMMPGMAGTELAKAIRARPGLESVTLVFMTASAREAEVERYLSLGAACVIAKPFDPLTLASEVRAQVDAARR